MGQRLRLDEIKARADEVHWTSTSIEQAMARMASSAADVPWLVSEVERLTRVIDAKPRQPLVVLNEYLDRAEKAETEVERLTDLCDEFRKREESQDRIRQRLTAEVERLRGWIDRSERQEARARRAEAEVERLTAERDALAAQVAQVEALAEEWEREAEDLLRNCYSGRDVFEAERTVQIVSELRAALAGSETDTSDTQTTDPGCGCSTNLARARYADGDPAGCYCTCSDDAREGCEHDPDEHQPTDQEDK